MSGATLNSGGGGLAARSKLSFTVTRHFVAITSLIANQTDLGVHTGCSKESRH